MNVQNSFCAVTWTFKTFLRTNNPNTTGFGIGSRVITIKGTGSGAAVAEFLAGRSTDGQSIGFFTFKNNSDRLVDFVVTRDAQNKSGNLSFRINNGNGGTGGANMKERLFIRHNRVG